MHYKPPTFNALFPEPRMRKKHAFNALVCYLGREPNRERGGNLFRDVLIRGMHETSTADWWDARFTWQWTPLSL